LLTAYNHYKEKHDNPNSDSEKENNMDDDANPTMVAETIACKAESCLKGFVQILIKLNNKVHEEAASYQKEAEEAL